MSINRQIAKSAAWSVATRLLNRGIGFVSTLILARLLVPADFGFVAMAMVIVDLLELINSYSLYTFLVQKEGLSHEDLNTVWTMQVLISLTQGAFVAGSAIPSARFYGEEQIVPIIVALAAGILISGFRNVGIMYFQRDMRFDQEFVLICGTKMVSFLVTIILAFALRSYWALVFGIVTSRAAEVVLSYMLHAYRPRFRLSNWRELVRFSKWVYLSNFLVFLGQRGPEFLIGKICGPGPVGLFSVGYDIAMLPTNEMIAPINRAVFPGYAKMSRNAEQLREGYLNVIGIIALIALPAAVGIAVTADVLVPLLLGNKWLDAIPIVQVLAFAGAFTSLGTNTGAVYLSLGRPRELTWLSGLRVGILIVGVLFFITESGALGVAMAHLLTAMIMSIFYFGLMIRTLQFSIQSLVARIYRPIFAVVCMYFSVELAMSVHVKSTGKIASIPVAAGLIMTGTCAYLFCIVLFWLAAGRPSGAETSIAIIVNEKVITRLMDIRKKIVQRIKRLNA